MGMIRGNDVLIIQIQCTDKCLAQFGEKMQRSAKECNVSANRFTACKTTDSLVDNCLENGGSQIFSCSTVIDEWLDIRLCKYTAASGDGVHGFVIFCIFVKTGSVCLKKRCHLVNKRTCTTGTDTIHTLLNIPAFKINDFSIFTAELNSYIGLRSVVLKSRGYGYDFLNERYPQMLGKCQSARSSDDRRDVDGTKFMNGTTKKIR